MNPPNAARKPVKVGRRGWAVGGCSVEGNVTPRAGAAQRSRTLQVEGVPGVIMNFSQRRAMCRVDSRHRRVKMGYAQPGRKFMSEAVAVNATPFKCHRLRVQPRNGNGIAMVLPAARYAHATAAAQRRPPAPAEPGCPTALNAARPSRPGYDRAALFIVQRRCYPGEA